MLYLDPGCPTFFGVYPTNLWDITQKRKDIQGPGKSSARSLKKATDQQGPESGSQQCQAESAGCVRGLSPGIS